ncbi:DUF87 domain-containing protein [Candidatus Gracilibacteria bacterium]|nr:DUF87 domain-containing protein [Candidatus Gracilibacteria bacterium]
MKLTKITALKNDLALTLASSAIRIEAPIRGQSLVGIEIPNEERSVVSMREIVESEVWKEEKSSLKLAVGRNVSGKPIVVDLAKMPHLLIAGKTGSGKSVGMNAFLCSLLWNNSPEDLKLILIDPKRVELKRYDKLPHLLTPVIVEPEKSVSALAWAVAEMNRRYRMLSEVGVVNLQEYNDKFPEKKEPRIVIVIDELADLMMVAGKDVEAAVVRIAQLARAVGMHLMVATQRPSVDVVTGLIKANLPARIAFRVSSQIDSRTIIDGMGAEGLLGLGDMLYIDGNSGNLTRFKGFIFPMTKWSDGQILSNCSSQRGWEMTKSPTNPLKEWPKEECGRPDSRKKFRMKNWMRCLKKRGRLFWKTKKHRLLSSNDEWKSDMRVRLGFLIRWNPKGLLVRRKGQSRGIFMGGISE